MCGCWRRNGWPSLSIPGWAKMTWYQLGQRAIAESSNVRKAVLGLGETETHEM